MSRVGSVILQWQEQQASAVLESQKRFDALADKYMPSIIAQVDAARTKNPFTTWVMVQFRDWEECDFKFPSLCNRDEQYMTTVERNVHRMIKLWLLRNLEYEGLLCVSITIRSESVGNNCLWRRRRKVLDLQFTWTEKSPLEIVTTSQNAALFQQLEEVKAKARAIVEHMQNKVTGVEE